MSWRAIAFATIAAPLCLIAEQLPIRSYTTADGLASDQIDCIVPDSRGFVWFCTPEGLTRFDGYRMVNFGTQDGLPDRRIDAFLETRSGAYLVGTHRGLSRFDPRAGGQGFVNYRQGAGVFDRPIFALFESPSGRIWCGSTAARLFEALSTVNFRLTQLARQDTLFVTDIKEDAGGKLWVATNGGIYVLGKDGAVKFIAELHGSPRDIVQALLRDHAGRIWAATRGGLLLMRDDEATVKCGVQRVYNEKDGLQTDPRALAEGPDGTIWLATGGGISVLPKSGDPPFRNLTRDHGLTDSSIYALAADKAGNIWAGTEGAGVMRIGSAGFTTFHARDGLATERVCSILADRTGTVIAVTEASAHGWWRSVNIFDAANLKFHAMVPKVFGEKASWALHPSLLHARTGEWWAATKAGLCRFAPMSVAELAARQPRCYTSEPGLEMFTVFEDSKGGIWASAQAALGKGNRLLRWDPARKTISWFEDGPGLRELAESFAEDHYGNVWMGPSRGDLFRYDGRRFQRFKRSEGVPAGVIDALLVDHTGRLWMGSTSGGLGLVENPGGVAFRVRTYNMAAGLASDTVLSLVEDHMGRIYAGTGKGVDRLDPATGHIKHFSTADGLAHGGVVSAFRDSSGNLWFGTMEGLSRLTPTADPPARPTVLITGLKLFGKTYPVSHAGEAHIWLPDLDPSRNQFQVAFVGFNGESEDRLRYTYKLDGAGSDWKAPDREHEANYPGLEPGHYRFLVKAVNSEDQASNTSAEIDFTVLPPFYGRWWFEAMAGAVIAGLVFAAYRYRLLEMTARVKLRYEERLDERTRIARELHDTLLQSLAGVSLQLGSVAKEIGPGSAGADRIGSVRQQVETTFREARQKIQDLRSPMLQEGALPVVMREALEQIAVGHPVHLHMAVAGQPHSLREELEEAILRIGQEAVANAVRHAQAGEIQVEMIYGDASLSLRVQDDGQGFDVDNAGRQVGHWGLRNMQERAHRIGAHWKISSIVGRGTCIEVIVPLKKAGPK